MRINFNFVNVIYEFIITFVLSYILIMILLIKEFWMLMTLMSDI